MSTTDRDATGDPAGDVPPAHSGLDDLLDRLVELERSVDDPDERELVRGTMRVARRIPGGRLFEHRIQKYTTRDIAESFVGAILLCLPFLVEDGVFVIAEWFVATTVAGVPIVWLGNIGFVVVLTVGLLYWTDIRDVQITNPLFGVLPRRLVGVLVVSFLTAAFLLVMWGRHAADDPAGSLEVLARISVLWVPAAFGSALGDILPGESRGHDMVRDNLEQIVRPNGD